MGLNLAKQARLKGLYSRCAALAQPEVRDLVKQEAAAWLLTGSADEAAGGDRVVRGSGTDSNQQVCGKCSGVGSLLCCDFCPLAFHLSCVGMTEHDVPAGQWACPACQSSGVANSKRW